MARFERGSLKGLALEVGSIVLGVLLALAVSEWAQDREYAEQARTALENLAREVEGNRDIMRKVHENNTATVAAMSLSSMETFPWMVR